MKKIMERVTKEANQIINQKEELSVVNEEVMSKQREILEKLAIIKELKSKNDESYKAILYDAKKLQKEHEILYNRYKKGKQSIERNISNAKLNIINDMKYNQRLVRKYMSEDLKNINVETLKSEEEELKMYMNLSKMSKERFEKLSPKQQEKIMQARKHYEEKEQRLDKIEEVVNYVNLVGNKNPEDVLKDIYNAIEEVNNNFNLENIDKLTFLSLDEKNPEENTKHEDVENVISYGNAISYEESQDKIKDVRNDILQCMKLMEKYREDPEKRKEILKTLKDLENQKKELLDVLGNAQSTIPSQSEGTKSQKDSPTGTIPTKESPKRVEQKRPIITFDRKTGNYTYIDENGEIPYENFFKPRYSKNGEKVKFHDRVHENDKAEIIKFAMDKGLTKKQAKMLDYRIYIVLNRENPQLVNKYIESFKKKGKIDMGFDIVYDLRKRNQKIERNIGYRTLRDIMKKAKAHEKLGIAQLFEDKSRTFIHALLEGTTVTAIGAGSDYANSKLEESRNETKEQVAENIDKLENVDVSNNKELQKENSIQNQDNELKTGDYTKINLKVDKFGNIVEKTEEQKIIDEEMEKYNKQKNDIEQQTKSKEK